MRAQIKIRDADSHVIELDLSFSAGSSQLGSGIGLAQGFEEADKAMYGAKRAGRHRMEIFDAETMNDVEVEPRELS